MRIMKSSTFDGVWGKTLWSTILVGAIIFLLVAPLYESRELIQVAVGTTLFAFWSGALWANVWTTREMQWVLSRPLPLIDKKGNLHPFMKVGGYYFVITHQIPWTEAGDRLYVLRGRSGDEDGKIFCVQTAHDYILPEGNFQVVEKTEARGGAPIRSFVFE